MLELNKIHCGACETVMRDINSDSVDCIVTDPPYQLSSPNTKNATKGFMGKSWDICPSVEIWEDRLRVLKPGAFAFVMCIPRQDCLARMICRLEDAGFNVAFSSIYHTFASGFPKAQNLSKVADKRAGMEREVVGCSNSGGYAHIMKTNKDQDYRPSDYYAKSGNLFTSNIPCSDNAKQFEGAYSGFQPKPAVEVIIVAMKPIEEKTYLDQALKNGHGCTWLDDCRIPTREKDQKQGFSNTLSQVPTRNKLNMYPKELGRFPANVLCDDNVLDDGRLLKPSIRPNIEGKLYPAVQSINFYGNNTTVNGYPDEGSFSRYFSLDAWFVERIKLLPKEAQKTFPWLIVSKASKSEKNRGLNELEDKTKGYGGKEHGMNANDYRPDGSKRKPVITKNSHTTVKPIKLMSWLITLASREGDTVLDPFCGSGTTAIAAKMLGRQYIGIEREEDYCEIARKRVSAVPTNLSRF